MKFLHGTFVSFCELLEGDCERAHSYTTTITTVAVIVVASDITPPG